MLSFRLSNQDENFSSPTHYCTKCGLPSNYPTAKFDIEGVCSLCNSFESYQQKTSSYFRSMNDLKELLSHSTMSDGDYHCMMLYSGGKDSTFALAQLVDMNLKVLAFTLDNGFISDQAKQNIERVVSSLGVDHIFGETSAMNAIFRDSLNRFANVCNGCFKTLYTLSTQVALEKNIPYIVTGLSRGQFFETRLTEELFTSEKIDADRIDETILNLRKTYHRADDAVSRLLDVSMFESDDVFSKVQFVDFYRFCDSSLKEMYEYLDTNLPWVRPTDTGRSTNCLINDLGIYYHKKKLGYHNYAFPYSWDVRTGHKKRDEALDELNDEIDVPQVRKMMEEIGFSDSDVNEQLVAFIESPKELNSTEIRNYLKGSLPDYMIPSQFILTNEFPLTENGKIDIKSLQDLTGNEIKKDFQEPSSEIEQLIADIWIEVLGIEKVGVKDDLISLGGQSLTAIRIMARLNETLYLDLPVSSIFEDQTIENQALRVEKYISEQLNDSNA